jgi:hypothetical protein
MGFDQGINAQLNRMGAMVTDRKQTAVVFGYVIEGRGVHLFFQLDYPPIIAPNDQLFERRHSHGFTNSPCHTP